MNEKLFKEFQYEYPTKYLDQNKITRYKIDKVNGIGQITLKAAADSKSGLTTKVIKSVTLGLDESLGRVLDSLPNSEKIERMRRLILAIRYSKMNML